MRAAELIVTRNEFYAKSYQKIKHLVAILLLITILLIGFSIYQGRTAVLAPKYLPTSPDGNLIISPPYDVNHLLLNKQTITANGEILGMPAPTLSYSQLAPFGENALVIYWAQLAVEDMFNYDYMHYRSVIEQARKFFTADGHIKFIEALVNSKNLQTVKARSAVVIPEITGQIKIINTEMYKGHYAWIIEVPLRLTYASAGNATPIVQNLIAQMSIGRISTLVCPFYGLAIYKLNFAENASYTGTQ